MALCDLEIGPDGNGEKTAVWPALGILAINTASAHLSWLTSRILHTETGDRTLPRRP